MSRICILQNSLTYGGTDTFVINMCKGLVMDGHDVTVILSMDEENAGPRLKELQDTGVSVEWTCSFTKGVLAKLNHLGLLFMKLKKHQFDVFQTNIDLFNGPQMLVAWLAGVPVRECHSHNSQQGRELRDGRTLKVRLYQSVMRWLCWTFSNRRGGCSEIAMDFLFGDKWKNDPHSKVVHNGIDFSAFRYPFDAEKKKKELKLTKKYNICTVGRIDYQKNPLFIVDVMSELFKLRDDCDFIWVGVGEWETKVCKKIDEYQIADRMRMLGSRKDVPEILRSSDIFFLPSRFEGLGIVLIEAQAAGLPCVAASTVPNEADCGTILYVPREQSASYWAQQLSDILDGKVQLHIDAERLDGYSIDHMVKEMEGLFER